MTSTKEWILSLEDLKTVIFYNPETGVFTWQVDLRGGVKAGDRAGCLNKSLGYRMVGINMVKYLEHRLAFFYMTGKWPTDQVDHINGDKADNSWANLRESSKQQNARNSKKHRDNFTGYKGVYFHARAKKFAARIMVGGNTQSLGYFDTAEQASVAYEAAAKEQFGEFFPDRLN